MFQKTRGKKVHHDVRSAGSATGRTSLETGWMLEHKQKWTEFRISAINSGAFLLAESAHKIVNEIDRAIDASKAK